MNTERNTAAELTNYAAADMVHDTHAEAFAESMVVHNTLRAAEFDEGRRPVPAVRSWAGTPGNPGYLLEIGRKLATGRAFDNHAIQIDHQGPRREAMLNAYEVALKAAGFRVERSLVKFGGTRHHLIVKR